MGSEAQLESVSGASDRAGTLYCGKGKRLEICDWGTDDHHSVLGLISSI